MYFVYIILSQKSQRFYIGQTSDLKKRLQQHNCPESTYLTRSGQPWVLYFSIECQTIKQAMRVERHIKEMKSRRYIENLTKYPDMVAKLLEKYR
ncbi:GIY-YIG nuclease family protein [Cytophagaceae bacterium ABcell3]|nr:GIY-YIG nuclease family protein [Cytophagaceae bacterium ABcell3]